MFDLHVHSIFSDGELLPSEIARRMAVKGNRGFAITDHADFTNISMILSNLHRIASYIEEYEAKFLVGVEITHVPPPLIGKAVELAWKEGAEIVVVHGETLAEPVAEGTNSAALNEEVNILAHPGLISVEEAEKAAENGIFLEISSRSGHCLANGHISRIAGATGCQLVINTDTHSPSDIISKQEAMRILIGSGIDRKDCERVLSNGKKLFNRLRK